jgi:hypothetical protein
VSNSNVMIENASYKGSSSAFTYSQANIYNLDACCVIVCVCECALWSSCRGSLIRR